MPYWQTDAVPVRLTAGPESVKFKQQQKTAALMAATPMSLALIL